MFPLRPEPRPNEAAVLRGAGVAYVSLKLEPPAHEVPRLHLRYSAWLLSRKLLSREWQRASASGTLLPIWIHVFASFSAFVKISYFSCWQNQVFKNVCAVSFCFVQHFKHFLARLLFILRIFTSALLLEIYIFIASKFPFFFWRDTPLFSKSFVKRNDWWDRGLARYQAPLCQSIPSPGSLPDPSQLGLLLSLTLQGIL